jgi:hypothetical protein
MTDQSVYLVDCSASNFTGSAVAQRDQCHICCRSGIALGRGILLYPSLGVPKAFRAFVARLVLSKPNGFPNRVQINFCITRHPVYVSQRLGLYRNSSFVSFLGTLLQGPVQRREGRARMISFKGTNFVQGIILTYSRWYIA